MNNQIKANGLLIKVMMPGQLGAPQPNTVPHIERPVTTAHKVIKISKETMVYWSKLAPRDDKERKEWEKQDAETRILRVAKTFDMGFGADYTFIN